MEKNRLISKNEKNNAIEEDKLSLSQNLVLDLLKKYSHDDIKNYLFNKDNKNENEELQIKLKELVDCVDKDEMAKLLKKEDINKQSIIQKNGGEIFQINSKSEGEKTLEGKLKSDNNYEKKMKQIKPFINKIIYKQNHDKDIICAYRYITVKKGNIYLLRCQDKFCKSKAYYNFESKEIAIYQEHSKELKNHINIHL